VKAEATRINGSGQQTIYDVKEIKPDQV